MKKPERIALVTGATSGIGRAIALKLAESGMRVVAVGRSTEKLSALKETTRHIIGVAADLSSDKGVEEVIGTVKKYGRLDALIHSAGIIDILSIERTDVHALDRQYRVNLRAVVGLTHGVLHLLIENKGQVVFMNSTAGLSVKLGNAAYSVTKFGLRAYADTLRAEVNAQGVRVVSVFPGSVATPMQRGVRQKQGMEYRPELLVQPNDIARLVSHVLTMPRTAEVTDITIRPFVKS